MRSLTVQEASQTLGRWLRRAIGGEQIAVHEGGCAVLLHPLPPSEPMTARETLQRLQSQPRLTAAQAEAYLHEVRTERLPDGKPGGSKIAGLAAH